MFRALAILILVVFAWGANAQTRLTTRQAKVTIAVTNTFQVALANQGARNGCTIQNRGSNNMFLFWGGSSAPADSTTSFVLLANQAINCSVGGDGVASDTVWITGTAGDVAIVSWQ